MKSAVSLARSCSIPVIMGMFSSRSLQQFATKLGMKVIVVFFLKKTKRLWVFKSLKSRVLQKWATKFFHKF